MVFVRNTIKDDNQHTDTQSNPQFRLQLATIMHVLSSGGASLHCMVNRRAFFMEDCMAKHSSPPGCALSPCKPYMIMSAMASPLIWPHQGLWHHCILAQQLS